MIRMAPFKEKLTNDDVVGKIVFQAQVRNWPGLSEPLFVTGRSLSRIYVSSLVSGTTPSDEGMIPEDCIGISWGYIGVSTVACVCDTIAEANAVKRRLDEVRALDGTAIGDPDAKFVPKTELPMMARTKGPSGSVNLSRSPWASREDSEAARHVSM